MSSLTDVTICRTCGVESTERLPHVCPLCADERQFVPPSGQSWVTRSQLESEGHTISVREVEPGLHALRTEPKLGIGQTCYLVQTEQGNLLFDVPPYIDAEAVKAVGNLGGIDAIAPSHPHMFGTQLEWSAAFNDAAVFVCTADAGWLQRTGHCIVTFDEQVEVISGMILRRVGGHFPGSSIAWWPGHDDAGVMLGGDTISPVARTGWVTFMRSFPNYLPLSANVVRRIAGSVNDLTFDRLYGNFGQQTPEGADAAVQNSAERYAAWVSGEHDELT